MINNSVSEFRVFNVNGTWAVNRYFNGVFRERRTFTRIQDLFMFLEARELRKAD